MKKRPIAGDLILFYSSLDANTFLQILSHPREAIKGLNLGIPPFHIAIMFNEVYVAHAIPEKNVCFESLVEYLERTKTNKVLILRSNHVTENPNVSEEIKQQIFFKLEQNYNKFIIRNDTEVESFCSELVAFVYERLKDNNGNSLRLTDKKSTEILPLHIHNLQCSPKWECINLSSYEACAPEENIKAKNEVLIYEFELLCLRYMLSCSVLLQDCQRVANSLLFKNINHIAEKITAQNQSAFSGEQIMFPPPDDLYRKCVEDTIRSPRRLLGNGFYKKIIDFTLNPDEPIKKLAMLSFHGKATTSLSIRELALENLQWRYFTNMHFLETLNIIRAAYDPIEKYIDKLVNKKLEPEEAIKEMHALFYPTSFIVLLWASYEGAFCAFYDRQEYSQLPHERLIELVDDLSNTLTSGGKCKEKFPNDTICDALLVALNSDQKIMIAMEKFNARSIVEYLLKEICF